MRKKQYLCTVIELERHIEILLLSNDCVIVPDFGGFMAHHVDARYDGRDNMFLPPLRTIGFNPQLQMNDSLLALSYVEAYDISYPDALNRIADDVNEVKQTLENTGKFEFKGIGTIMHNEDGNYTFEPYESGILTPDYYGLGGFDMLPLAQLQQERATETENKVVSAIPAEANPGKTPEKVNSVFIDEDEEEEEETTAEFVNIKKSWLRNVAAACIALIAFFALSTPLGSPTIQKSQIDTGMLTRIMPKELVTGEANKEYKMEKSQDAVNQNATTSEVKDEVETQAAPYYSIVLASRVTKRNAASYAEALQKKGFKEARVLISSSNVKVIYGNYATEGEAYSTLNKLHNNEAFADGWVTKVQE